MADYVILHEIDKCTRCRGCQVACQRGQGLKKVPDQVDGVWANPGQNPGGNRAEKVQFDDPVVVKAQKPNDSPPFVRYSCWHCYNAPCVPSCPFKAIRQDTETGAVFVDHDKCMPELCQKQCVTNCGRGGYPKIGDGDKGYKAYKCDMCLSLLKDTTQGDAIGQGRRMPRCVYTCPAKALNFGTKAEIDSYINSKYPASATRYIVGNGHVIWVSKKLPFDPPTTDPYIEDHISPMFGKIATSTAGKLLTVPTVAIGALYALYRRRVELSGEKA